MPSMSTYSESQASNSSLTPGDELPSSDNNFEAPSTGKSSLGDATMIFQIGDRERTAAARERIIQPSSKKSRSIEPVITRLSKKRTPDKTVEYVNPYEGNNYEYINEVLHGIYPINSNGVIMTEYFDIFKAEADVGHLQNLKRGTVEYDESNILTQIWIKKIKAAIKLCVESEEFFI